MALQYGTDEYDREYQAELDKRLQAPPPYIYLTPEWVSLYEKAVQGDAPYRESAQGWEGKVCLHVEAEPKYGLDIALYIVLDLWHGDCRSAKIVPTDVGEASEFVITGTADRWLQVIRKELDTIKGMMQGKLKLKGDLPTIVRYVKAAARLVEIATEVGGKFPDELPPEGVEGLRNLVNDLSAKFLS
jgi:putative sterol carrier protein